MKKYILFIITIILFIFCFLYGWYSDYLTNLLFIFIPIISLILFVIWIVLMIVLLLKIRKRKGILDFCSIGILIIITLFSFFFPYREIKTRVELSLFESERLEVIEMIINDELVPSDEYGNVELPSKYKKLSTSGEVSVYQNDDNGVVVCFWIFRGLQSGSIKLIYSTGGEELIRENEKGHPIISIEKLRDNWYYVITDY